MDRFVLYIPESIELSREQLQALCERNHELRIETDQDQNLIIMSPAASTSGNQNAFLTSVFYLWNRKYDLGRVYDSSSGFELPDGSMKAPDTSFIFHERWDALPEEKKKGFAQICPDFVLELRSPSDRKKDLLAKMEIYIKNGCRMAWLIDPLDMDVHIFRPDSPTETIEFDANTQLSGGDVLPNFVLELGELLD